MKNENKLLKILGIIFSIIVILLFLDFALEAAISGWKNPH